MPVRWEISSRALTYLILTRTSIDISNLADVKVKYCALLSELVGNVCVTNNQTKSNDVHTALAVSTFVFGLLEGGACYWKSRIHACSAATQQVPGV